MVLIYTISFRSLIAFGCIFCAVFLYLAYADSKPKQDYGKIRGEIVYLGKTYQDFPLHGNEGNNRYIILNNYSFPMELYVGKEGFPPKYECVDSLKTGDIITIYHQGPSSNNMDYSVQFIDRNNQPVFVRSNSKRNAAIYVALGCPLVFALLGYFFWKKGKIPY